MKKGLLLIVFLMFAILSAIGQNNPPPGGGLPIGTGPLNPVSEGDTIRVPIQFFPAAPADSQLSKISFTLKWNPDSGLGFIDQLFDTAKTTLKNWTFIVEKKSDAGKSIDISMVAPANAFYIKDDKPGKLLDLILKVEKDNNHDMIRLLAENVRFTLLGNERQINNNVSEIGIIVDKEGNTNPPQFPLSIVQNLAGTPNTKMNLPFLLNGIYTADSSYLGFTIDMVWMPRSLMKIENVLDTNKTFLKGWNFTFSVTDSSAKLDIAPPSGKTLVKTDPKSEIAFSLKADISSHETIKEIDVLAKSLIVKRTSGNRELAGTKPIYLGKINLGTGGGDPGGGGTGNPYGDFIPLLASDTGRVNNGLYGGSVLDFAWDDVNKTMYAASEAASSLYASADSGKTWLSPFPTDSLEWYSGNQRRGWGGRGVHVVASKGYVYSVSVENAGTLNASQVKRPGSSFTTLMDETIGRSAFPTNQNLNIRISSLDAIGKHVIVNGEKVLFRSDDAGLTWGLTFVPNQSTAQNYKISQVGVLKEDADFALVVAEKATEVSMYSRLYKTSDGLTFKDISPIDTDTLNIDRFELHPTNRDTIFVTTRKSDGKTDGIWRTFNGGTSWVRIKTIDQGAEVFKNLPRLFVYQTKGSTLVIVMSGSGNSEVSTDLGATFQPIDPKNDPASNVVTNGAVGQAHITDSDIFFGTGDTGPTRSETGLSGVFKPVPDGIEGVNVWKIAQSPNVLDTLYLATSSGIAFTTVYTREDIPGRQKWMPPYGKFPINPNNGGNTGFTAIQVYEKNPFHVVAANGNGIFVSKTGGKTNDAWTSIDFNNITGLDGQKMRDEGGRISDIAFLNADTIYATVSVQRDLYGNILASYNGGTTWAAIPGVDTKHSYNALKKAVRGSTTYFYTVTGGMFQDNVIDPGAVFRSIDRGKTWTKRGEMPDAQFNPLGFPMPANDVEIVPNSLDTLYFAAGTNLSNVVGVSYNGGTTVDAVFGGYEGAFASVAINKDNPDSVYFAVRRNIFLFDAKTQKTELLFRGFPGELTYDLLYDGLTQGSSGGFFNVKRPGAKTSSSIFDNQFGSRPNQIELRQNFPNPFNPTTTIVFNLPQAKAVQLEVFNVLGQKVATLIQNEYFMSGAHSIRFDASRLASGVYFYTLTTDNVTLTQKMLLIK